MRVRFRDRQLRPVASPPSAVGGYPVQRGGRRRGAVLAEQPAAAHGPPGRPHAVAAADVPHERAVPRQGGESPPGGAPVHGLGDPARVPVAGCVPAALRLRQAGGGRRRGGPRRPGGPQAAPGSPQGHELPEEVQPQAVRHRQSWLRGDSPEEGGQAHGHGRARRGPRTAGPGHHRAHVVLGHRADAQRHRYDVLCPGNITW